MLIISTGRVSRVKPFTGGICSTVLDKDGGGFVQRVVIGLLNLKWPALISIHEGFFWFLAGPSAPPPDVRGKSQPNIKMALYCITQLPTPERTRVVSHYRRFPQTVVNVVATPKTQTTLTGLNQGTLYSITESAFTIKGDITGLFLSMSIATGKNSALPIANIDKCKWKAQSALLYLIPKWRPINYSFVCMLISPFHLVNMYSSSSSSSSLFKLG